MFDWLKKHQQHDDNFVGTFEVDLNKKNYIAQKQIICLDKSFILVTCAADWLIQGKIISVCYLLACLLN